MFATLMFVLIRIGLVYTNFYDGESIKLVDNHEMEVARNGKVKMFGDVRHVSNLENNLISHGRLDSSS